MNPFNQPPQTGDLVAARRNISCTLTEEYTNSPSVRQGTRGLVRKRTGNQLTVAFDTSYGLTESTVHARDCRLIQRTADEKRFMEWTQLKTAVRIGALITLIAPILWYVVVYWAQTGSLDGVIEALIVAALESALELPGLILAHPTQTLVWIAVGALVTRIALGPRPRRKRRKQRR
ncbi:hypothetical protein ASF98_18855 [Arthrobacter sp. Leaf337]|uniref:hypothetical protein n=1 Tax=Arthrobacter sp. Leaf337 TaxID=1736342 RepID=UPI0006F7A283|nr:hypothetical protein [Arthrobacter sp. Leaf337]KQR80355.1 hypothetical protein ASF98_18855 [Arthrobacter sp. Leaf337]